MAFVQNMVPHHEDAVHMVSGLFAGGGGRESSVFPLATHIDSDQRVEIARECTMLAGLVTAH